MSVRERATPIPERPAALPTPTALREDMPPISLRLASSFTSAAPQLGSIGAATTSKLARLSAGALELKFHEPGALVGASNVFDAVASGEVDAGWTSTAPSAFSSACPSGRVPRNISAGSIMAAARI